MNEQTKIGYMGEFPDFNAEGFIVDEYNKRFHDSNVIIRAKTKSVAYPQHWGPLSIKCAFNGTDYHKSNDSIYAVNDSHFLLFNQGKTYSSWIESQEEVECFTVNFTPRFEKEVTHSILSSHHSLLDAPDYIRNHDFNFTERLYPHDNLVSPILLKIRELSADLVTNNIRLNECFYYLFEALVHLQEKTNYEIESIQKQKHSTRTELYKRLIKAKDFIYSSYNSNLSLEEIGNVACLNHFYFLREFKKAFHVTPNQFLTQRRLEVASMQLQNTNKGIAEICSEVGYGDISSFSRLFKRNYNFSPLEFRKLSKRSHLK